MLAWISPSRQMSWLQHGLCRCSEMPWIFAAARGYCQEAALQPCTVHYTPAHWEKFYYLLLHLISGLSPLIWDQGLTGPGVTSSANQRPVFPVLTNERLASGHPAPPTECRHQPGWCRHCRGPGLAAWPWLSTGSSEFVLVSSPRLGSVEDEDQRIESLLTPGLNTSAQ